MIKRQMEVVFYGCRAFGLKSLIKRHQFKSKVEIEIELQIGSIAVVIFSIIFHVFYYISA